MVGSARSGSKDIGLASALSLDERHLAARVSSDTFSLPRYRIRDYIRT